ncbi:MAG: pyrroloquinoline quinone-dependent dehydrogenase [Micropepsaceae bacterium]
MTFALAVLAAASWAFYGGDAGGQKFSAAAEITPANVDELIPAWSYSTGDMQRRDPAVIRRMKMQTTPILADGRLLMCTPFNEIIALDPGTGRELWRHDPQVDTSRKPGNGFNCRGVAAWSDPTAASDAACARRVFTGTSDGRLIAVDAQTGAPCAAFGEGGTVRIDWGMAEVYPGEVQISSAPVVAGDRIIVGSAISDNRRLAAPHGTVRAYDARSGALAWTFDPIPRRADDAVAATWGDGWRDAGHANVWAPMSVDEGRGLVFLPTSSPSPDFFGGLRPGANAHADSVVALEAATGRLVWSFQTVHHDVWDYDLPAQPVLATLKLGGVPRDVVIQGTKQGFIFVLDRETGAPVFPVEERPVPQDGAPGEALSPTQPFPADLPALTPQRIAPEDAFGLIPFYDGAACRDALAASRNEGLYTPPSLQGTVLFPFTGGGINWGGVAVDAERGVIYANTSRAVHRITLFPASELEAMRAAHPGKEVSAQEGAPFGMMREALLSPLGMPCNAPPWGALVALDLNTRQIRFEATLGTTEALAPRGLTLAYGTPALAGPIVTRGGLIFTGAAMDQYLRAFDAATGEELWQGRLPAPGIATPISYEWEGSQYVVIAAGGHSEAPSDVPRGDSLVAFRLPKAGEAGPSLWSRTIDRPGGRFYALSAASLAGLGLLVFAAVRFRRARRRA